MALPLEILVLVHIRKENVLLNIHVNLVYKKIDAWKKEDTKIQRVFY